MTASLDITWAMPEPSVKPSAWQPVEPSPSPADSHLETRLGWPEGTLAALRAGFDLRLGRSTGWEGEDPAVAAAARVFRRGVAWRRPGEAAAAPQQRSGRYQVKTVTGSEPPAAALGRTQTFRVVDARVAAAWPALAVSLKAAPNAVSLALDEHSKTLDAVATILEAARAAGSPSQWTVVGGGILSDVAGFAAGLAGAAVEFVPTTLLAMADACVGGKTGVNFPPYGKNQLGLFHFPTAVHVWAGWLSTLPDRELRAGGAECLKHAFLAGNMPLAGRLADALAERDLGALTALLPAVMAVKADIVAEDPAETGRRAVLNFGHTLGHALEGYSHAHTDGDETILHGEAVGIGMAFAIALSRSAAALSAADGEHMLDLMRRADILMPKAELQRCLGGIDLADTELLNELKRFIGQDKKNAADKSKSAWILLDAPGVIARESTKSWTIGVFASELTSTWDDLLLSLP